MSTRALLLLFALVLALGGGLYLSIQRDQHAAELQELPLFPGFDPARVRTLAAENVRRGWHLRVVRDERGGWRMLDPIEMPANAARIEHLLASALARRGSEVPASEREAVLRGFTPPRLVLEVEELVDGQPRHERVEFGDLDADGSRVNVRVRGTYLRVLRDVDTALDRQIDEFKTDLPLEFAPGEVVRVRRSGRILCEGATAAQDVALDLVLEEGRWRALAPVAVEADLTMVATWLQGLAGMHHSGEVDELGAPLEQYGVEPPELQLELELRDGTRQALHLGRPGRVEGQVWYCVRRGLDVLWTLQQSDAWLVGFPLESMLDARVLRARREEIDTITLRSAAGDLYFAREGTLWRVALRRAGEKGLDRAVEADRGKVEDLIGALAQIELEGFRLGQAVAEREGGPAVWVGVGGTTQGGFLGEHALGAGARECVLFQRRGENACSLAPRSLEQLVAQPIENFWNRRLADLAEHTQSALVIRGLGQTLRYERDRRGKWVRHGREEEAKELHPVLDPLCFLRAARYLPPRAEPAAEWDEPLTVEFLDAAGREHKIEIGRARGAPPDEAVEIVYDKLRAVAHEQGLHGKLVALLRGS